MPISDDFSKRIKLIKYYFLYRILKTERNSKSLILKGKQGIWQRRFWEHCIGDDSDYRTHIDYIYMNPVKHGYVIQVKKRQFLSLHRYVKDGLLELDWGGGVRFGVG